MCMHRISRLGEIIRFRLVIIQRENSWLGAQRNGRVLPGKLQTILSSETLNSGKVLKKSCQTRHLFEILREGKVLENLKVPLEEIHQLRKNIEKTSVENPYLKDSGRLIGQRGVYQYQERYVGGGIDKAKGNLESEL